MLILAADTSGKYGSIALVRCEAQQNETTGLAPLQGGTFSAQLIPQIADLLSKHNLSKLDIEGLAVVSGPGSFTGLRVGLAAIKALAEILQKPIAAVTLLEAIAFDLSPEKKREVLIALDAGRSEAFVGRYRVGAELPGCIRESLLTVEELALWAKQEFEALYTPDENLVQSLARAGLASSATLHVRRPTAASVAPLGYKKIMAGQTVAPAKLDATYIRRADAEINKPVRTPA